MNDGADLLGANVYPRGVEASRAAESIFSFVFNAMDKIGRLPFGLLSVSLPLSSPRGGGLGEVSDFRGFRESDNHDHIVNGNS